VAAVHGITRMAAYARDSILQHTSTLSGSWILFELALIRLLSEGADLTIKA
jgi:hypothetical protein